LTTCLKLPKAKTDKSRGALKKIKQNLTISFVYNAITITIATGLFYSITNSLILTPTLAALGWIVSDTSVFGNSLLIRKFVPRDGNKNETTSQIANEIPGNITQNKTHSEASETPEQHAKELNP